MIYLKGLCGGESWFEEKVFPLHIFTCDDPLQMANVYTVNKKAFKLEAERQEKIATVKRLQDELLKDLR